MPGLVEINQIGKREDLADFISMVDMKEKPLLAMIPKGKKLTNMFMQWQADKYEDPDLTGTADGVDVDNFENGARNRVLLQAYCQKKRRAAMVGDIAENVSDVAGASTGELARATKKKLEELARDIESVLCSDKDTQVELSKDQPYLTRGLGSWISNAAQTTLPVNANFVPPAASIYSSGAIASLTESGTTSLRSVLKSVYQQTGRRRNLVLLAGPALQETITNFTSIAGTAGSDIALRSYNADLATNKITTRITLYEGDFNTVEIHPSLFLAKDSAAAVQAARGYVIDPEVLELRYNRMPRVMPLQDEGGGPRNLVDAIFGLVCKNPLSLGKFNTST